MEGDEHVLKVAVVAVDLLVKHPVKSITVVVPLE